MADEVAAEASALAGGVFSDDTENLVRSGRWSMLKLYYRGRKNEDYCSLFPQTVAVIEANRSVLRLGGDVFFSVLDPDTHVAPHNGPTNMRVRCQLGVDVPEGCGLRVGGITRTWEQGRCLVFDDSFLHEVWNRGTRPRVVLIVDLWPPDLTDDEVALLNGLQLPPMFPERSR
jgi:aspartyl/asparaginyl beta-hydroxylase (cupin superfamily)